MSTSISGAGKLKRLGLPAAVLVVLLPMAGAFAASEVTGRYSVLRDDKDTGCMLTLFGGGKAQLAPACRDNGIVVFDPVKWAMDHGRLALTARKGHKAHFEKDDAGLWRRDAKEGGKSALAFKPIP
ncbi:AprI/Inh family metalloprotease inhibitor [Methylocystis sp. IM3]|uniref:AprI/Inh family metalloprotease inhibitor n=1 Tax=unclassified Methylocystis TaxID=2625913 RepID=UPI0030F94ECC